MRGYISVKTPVNLSQEEAHLFLPHLRYQLDPLRVKRIKNALITYSGLCVNRTGLIKECHHWYPWYYDSYISEVASFQRRIESDPGQLIIFDDDNVYLSIFHPWYNYYHWICESIFRLWMVREQAREMILVLPEYYRSSGFIMPSLENFRFKDIYFIPQFKSLLVRNLCLPQIKPWVDGYDKRKLRQVRDFYLSDVLPGKGLDLDLGERLYVSRKKAARKKVANEPELEDLLHAYGFAIINNEDYSFFEQLSIFSHAKYLISIHGSGLTNMLVMKENAHILEFQKRSTNDRDWHSRAFWYLADALEYSYYHQLCEPIDPADDYYHANISVAADRLENNIRFMLSQ